MLNALCLLVSTLLTNIMFNKIYLSNYGTGFML